MRNTYIVDGSIDIQARDKYEMSIQFSLNGFSFSIRDIDKKKYIAFAEYKLSPSKDKTIEQLTRELNDIFRTEKLLQSRKYKRVNCVFISNKHMLVPRTMFQNDTLKQMFEVQNDLTEDEELNTNFISEIDSYQVFSFPGEFSHFLRHNFSNVQAVHSGSVVLTKIKEMPKIGYGFCVINTGQNNTSVMLTRNQKLILYNSFECNTVDDTLYYLSAITERFKLGKAKMPLLVNCDEKDALYAHISKYFSLSTIAVGNGSSFHQKIKDKDKLRNFYIFQ